MVQRRWHACISVIILSPAITVAAAGFAKTPRMAEYCKAAKLFDAPDNGMRFCRGIDSEMYSLPRQSRKVAPVVVRTPPTIFA